MSTQARDKHPRLKPMKGFKTWADEAVYWQTLIAADNLPKNGWTEGPSVVRASCKGVKAARR